MIWTAPAGDALLDEALRRVAPRKILWVCRDPQDTAAQAFLTRLAGLVKYALRAYGGRLSVQKLAAACGQRIEAVLAGLEILAGQGWLRIAATSGEEWQVTAGGSQDLEIERLGKARLTEILTETAAFRALTRRAEVERLSEGIHRKKINRD